MVLFYERINWENYPSMNTAISALNLNKIDLAVKTLDERTVQLNTTKAEQATVLNTVQDWSLDESTGIITITKVNGEKISFDLNIEKIPVNFELSEDGILSMTTDDGTVFTADIGSMIPIITFESSDTVYVDKLLGKKTIGTDVEYNSNLEYEFAEPYNGNLYITPSSYASGTIGAFYDVELHSLDETTYSETVYVQEQKIIPCTNIAKIVVTNNGSAKLTIAINDSKNATYKFGIPDGAITEQKLNPNYLADLKLQAETATQSATSASESATQASASAQSAKESEERAKLYADNAEAVSGVGIATKDKAGLVKGGENTIAEDGTLLLTRTTTDRTLTESHAGGLKINSMDGESQQDGTPTPDTPIDIKSVEVSEIKGVGKNLYNEASLNNGFVNNGITATKNSKGQLNFSGTTTATVNAVMQPFTLPAGTYYMTVNGGTKVTPRLYNRTSATFLTWRNGKFTLTEEAKLDIRILIENGVTVSGTVQIQIEEGSTATDYEPYHEKSIQLSAPITLRGIGDVKDVLCKRDGVYGALRKVGKYIIDGTETWSKNSTDTSDYLYYFFKSSRGLTINSNNGYCSHFRIVTGSTIKNGGVILYDSGFKTTFYLGAVNIGLSSNTLNALKAWLTENNVEVIYEIAEPTFEPLPIADQILLHQLETFDTVTYIFTDSEIEPIIEVEYGTSKVGAYTIKGMNTADANSLKIEQLTTLTNDIATQLVAGSEV